MFSLFYNQPAYRTYYYHPYDPFEIQRRQIHRARYLNYLENRLASLFNNDLDFFSSDKPLPNQSEQQQKQHAQTSESQATTPPVEAPPAGDPAKTPQQPAAESMSPNETPKQDVKQEVKQDVKQPCVKQYRFESRSTYNGGDYVEERREKFVGDDGGVHVRSRRRLGDRWYEVESHTNSEGKTTEREAWHNVGDDQIASFKDEWESRHQRPALKQQQSPSATTCPQVSDEKHV
jgi:hypothetical protein